MYHSVYISGTYTHRAEIHKRAQVSRGQTRQSSKYSLRYLISRAASARKTSAYPGKHFAFSPPLMAAHRKANNSRVFLFVFFCCCCCCCLTSGEDNEASFIRNGLLFAAPIEMIINFDFKLIVSIIKLINIEIICTPALYWSLMR